MNTIDFSFELNPEKMVERISHVIRKGVEDSKANGVVVGLSGGIDSTLTATLCTKTLGKDRVLGILMPAYFTPPEDVQDALDLVSMLGIQSININIDDICRSFIKTLKINDEMLQKMAIANIRARIRMIVLYFFANTKKLLVAGTGDRSEWLIGFFTKHGDGAADFFPIIDLYKTEVRQLAVYLGIPQRMAYKPSSPQLYQGHKLSDELPMDYEKLDPILKGLFDFNLPPNEVSEITNISQKIVLEMVKRHEATEHKREKIPIKIV